MGIDSQEKNWSKHYEIKEEKWTLNLNLYITQVEEKKEANYHVKTTV